jgi:hypothetical protein
MPGASSTRRSRFRFYARWLQEFGQLKSAPNAVIADGADWRFLNELKRELKAGEGPPGGSSLPGGFEISGEFRCRSFSGLGTSGPSPNLADRSALSRNWSGRRSSSAPRAGGSTAPHGGDEHGGREDRQV